MGDSPKWVKSKKRRKKKKEREKERERERLNNGDNNGQATHGARKHAWRMQAAWANYTKHFRSELALEMVPPGSLINTLYMAYRELNSSRRLFCEPTPVT